MRYYELHETQGLVHIDQLPELLHKDAVEKFQALADGQRHGPPERLGGASLYNRGIQCSGLYSGLTEHVGDITHRMADSWDWYHGMSTTVREKVNLGLRRIEGRGPGYPPGAEIRDQVIRNYEYMSHPHRDIDNFKDSPRFQGNLKAWFDFWTTAGNRYADAHAALTVWNEAQWHAREAAVASGRLNFAAAKKHLEALQLHLKSPENWIAYAGQVTMSGETIVPYGSRLTEDAHIDLTPNFIQRITRAARSISFDIAADLPKGPALVERVNTLLARINQSCPIEDVMTVERAEIRPKAVLNNLGTVGCHWCWEDGAAQIYHHDNAYEDAEREGYKRSDLVEIILVANVQFQSIDWPYTIATNLIHPAECEITIRNNARIMLIDIANAGSGYIDITPDQNVVVAGYYP
jgi:hypothetical protein